MTFQDIIDAYGSVTKAARELNRSRATMHNWKRNGIPEGQKDYVKLKLEKMKNENT